MYKYDVKGNLASITASRSFAWDVFNWMTSASGLGGTATNTYNGDGLKTRRIGPDGTTRYYYDGIRPIWEADGAGAMKAQLDRDIFGNLLSRKEPAGTRRYYHFDGLGSTTALTDEGGAAVATLLYDAWGNQRAATGAIVPNYRFTGAELDTASGLYHMGARFYDPTIGRWLSEDSGQNRPFDPGTLNAYAYVNGNPLTLVDQDGESPILAALVIGALVGLITYVSANDGNVTLTGALGNMAIGAGAAVFLVVAGEAVIVGATREGIRYATTAAFGQKISEHWTSINNFIAHHSKHLQDVAKALGKTTITRAQYLALSIQAAQQGGLYVAKDGTLARILALGGGKYGVAIVNAAGKIITYYITGDVSAFTAK